MSSVFTNTMKPEALLSAFINDIKLSVSRTAAFYLTDACSRDLNDKSRAFARGRPAPCRATFRLPIIPRRPRISMRSKRWERPDADKVDNGAAQRQSRRHVHERRNYPLPTD